MTTNSQWFDIDRTGLSKLLERRGIEFAVFELIQNAWDEAGVTSVEVLLQPADLRGYSMLTVVDNSAEGFADLRHAYTLFAESKKKGNAEQRGRFNIGEKLVLSLCKWAVIQTTKGTVTFSEQGRSETKTCRPHGTEFQALIKMNAEQRDQVATEVQKLITPKGIVTKFNCTPLPDWTHRIEREFEAQLNTEVADADGVLRRTWRKTTVRCYAVRDGETAHIYELGLPVCEHDCAFHCDVQQKVPLTIDRENVTPRFLAQLRTAVFNATHEMLNGDECSHEWAQTAIESGDAEPEAVKDYMEKRFGELRASYDPNDAEANNQAVAHGYTLVHGSMLTKEAWQNVRAADAITSAGKLFPTHSDNIITPNEIKPTTEMQAVADYCRALGVLLLGFAPTVNFISNKTIRACATYGSRTITFNVAHLGRKWFDLAGNRRRVDDLIIHEFGHEYAANHLSEAYNDALSGLAAKAMELGRKGLLPNDGDQRPMAAK